MPTTFTLAIDWERDSGFTGAQDDVRGSHRVENPTLGEKRVSRLKGLGTQKPWQDKADNSMLALTLPNDDRLYSPDNAASPLFGRLVPQRPVRIQSNDGTTIRTHWVGWIAAIKPGVGRLGERTVQILASGRCTSASPSPRPARCPRWGPPARS